MNTYYVMLVLVVVVVVVAIVGCQATRAGYASAPYTVVRKDGKCEVRDYPALTVVETTMAPTGSGANGSFGRLFGFITGKNAAKQKIAMTTPVFMAGSDTSRTMAFVMPASLKSGQVPQPADRAVMVREQVGGRFAVLRYSGGRNDQREAEELGRLQDWMAAQGLPVLSPPVYGYFDPPWTPPFLRRNEVMLRTTTTP